MVEIGQMNTLAPLHPGKAPGPYLWVALTTNLDAPMRNLYNITNTHVDQPGKKKHDTATYTCSLCYEIMCKNLVQPDGPHMMI